jgi:cell division protein FtsI/penicillin-binding protein 2
MLAGRDGARFVEVDAMGRIVNPRSTVGVLPPEPGGDVQLTLDLELQKYVRSIFPDTMKGAIAAMVPSTGEILALYSHPGFDPNDFVGGILPRLWRALHDDPNIPLLDRTMVRALPARLHLEAGDRGGRRLEKGLVNANTRMPIGCTGGMSYAGRYSRCWNANGHGSPIWSTAIAVSCNVYFYQVGIQLGPARAGGGRHADGLQHAQRDRPARARRRRSSRPASTGIGTTSGTTADAERGDVAGDRAGAELPDGAAAGALLSAIGGDGTAPEPHLVPAKARARGMARSG